MRQRRDRGGANFSRGETEMRHWDASWQPQYQGAETEPTSLPMIDNM